MNIVNRQTFLTMPEGTIYAKIDVKWIVGDTLCVKYENLGNNDWYYTAFNWVDANDSREAIDRLGSMDKDPNVSYPVQQLIARDGLYEEDAKFLIYEQADIDFIVGKLRGEL